MFANQLFTTTAFTYNLSRWSQEESFQLVSKYTVSLYFRSNWIVKFNVPSFVLSSLVSCSTEQNLQISWNLNISKCFGCISKHQSGKFFSFFNLNVFKPHSRKAGWFLALPSVYFIFLVLSVSRPKLPLGQLSLPDDAIISQLEAMSHLFSSYPTSGAFCQVSKLRSILLS